MTDEKQLNDGITPELEAELEAKLVVWRALSPEERKRLTEKRYLTERDEVIRREELVRHNLLETLHRKNSSDGQTS